VTDCGDDVFDSATLRSTVANPSVQSGDTVAIACSTVSLSTGELAINQTNLTLLGALALLPTSIAGTIDHEGTGVLALEYLTLRDGGGHTPDMGTLHLTRGGCVYSKGSVVLSHSTVAGCSAYNGAQTKYVAAQGGGVFAAHNLIMVSSSISYNAAITLGGRIDGGGAYVGGNVVAKYSTISGNLATLPNSNVDNSAMRGGGLWVYGNVSISNSTISGNSAFSGGGGIEQGIGGTSFYVSDSTISGNTPLGLLVYSSATIQNSTIAFNAYAGVSTNYALTLKNTLIAGNGMYDVRLPTTPGFVVQGGNNLVRTVSDKVKAQLPPDTLTGVCPLLGPLRDNGGATLTHALYSGSPAIDAGADDAAIAYDQRGGPQPVPDPIPPPPLAYARDSGAHADIGAYETQQRDAIFSGGLEGCP